MKEPNVTILFIFPLKYTKKAKENTVVKIPYKKENIKDIFLEGELIAVKSLIACAKGL